MPDPVVALAYLFTYGGIVAYAVWLHLRHRRAASSR